MEGRIRRGRDRGQTELGWLSSAHTFSFGEYHDPAQMGFRTLRVINEDRVAPGKGFGPHPHRDMEILTWVLSGALRHEDSLGTGSVIRPGDLQRMSAGTGVVHSEWNASATEPVHFLQIWIVPNARGTAPSYAQHHFAAEALRDRFRLVASADARDGSLPVQQDADFYVASLTTGARVTQPLAAGVGAWLQVAKGRIRTRDQVLEAGDAIALENAGQVEVEAEKQADVLLFALR